MRIAELNPASDPLDSGAMTLAGLTGRLLGILVLVALAVALCPLTDILVLLFSATLLALRRCAAAWPTGVCQSFALAGVFMLGPYLFGNALLVFGSTVATQLDEGTQAAPTRFKLLMARMNSHSHGWQMIDQVRGMNVVGATGWTTSTIATAAGLITRTFGEAVIALLLTSYLTTKLPTSPTAKGLWR